MPLATAGARSVLGEAARLATRRRTGDRAAAAHARQAERYVELLGEMKGAAMKLGQVLSFVDGVDDVVPPEYRQLYRHALAALQDSAPPMEPALVAEVVEAELGRPPDRVFSRFSTIPIAAASIGQVHAATLDDGTEVAVKVQYPGVADAIRSDLANTDLLVALVQTARRLVPDPVPNVDPRPLIEEIRDRIGEELDYRVEAANQQEFVDLYAGHDRIRVPFVVHELTTGRVLTMEMVDGRRWPAAVESDQSLRDRWGQTINRFVYGSLYCHHAFNADPHPGNYLFHEDGTVTFLDFGCVKRFDPAVVDALLRIDDAVLGGDADALVAELRALGFVPPHEDVDPARILEWYRPTFDPILQEQPFTYTPEFAAGVVRRHYDSFGEWRDVIRHLDMPRELLFLNRILVGHYSVLAGLRATGEWRRLRDELLATRSRPSPRP